MVRKNYFFVSILLLILILNLSFVLAVETTNYCGDGVINNGEVCDKNSATANQPCIDLLINDNAECNNSCQCELPFSPNGVCEYGDGEIIGADGNDWKGMGPGPILDK